MQKSKQVFASNIVQRFMTASEFETFLQKYYANRHSFRNTRGKGVNDTDREIYQDLKVNKMPLKEVLAKYKVSHSRAQTAVMRVVLQD